MTRGHRDTTSPKIKDDFKGFKEINDFRVGRGKEDWVRTLRSLRTLGLREEEGHIDTGTRGHRDTTSPKIKDGVKDFKEINDFRVWEEKLEKLKRRKILRLFNNLYAYCLTTFLFITKSAVLTLTV